ncbi:MAG: YfiR family protein [Paludibacteraceae bacterium]
MFVFYLGIVSVKAQNEKFKALFLYNFIKNIEWPQAYKQGDLVIGVLGNTPILKELETITGNQKAGNQPMKVKFFSNAEEVSSCHLIYVSPNKGGAIAQLLTKVNGNNTLIVSDSKGGIQQGSGINFIMDGDKLKFEISKHNIETKGLKVSASLLNLGVAVN